MLPRSISEMLYKPFCQPRDNPTLIHFRAVVLVEIEKDGKSHLFWTRSASNATFWPSVRAYPLKNGLAPHGEFEHTAGELTTQ
jgi:hypothetical protein